MARSSTEDQEKPARAGVSVAAGARLGLPIVLCR
jgi:hypothetical protein